MNLFVQSPNLSHLDVAHGGGNQLWFGTLFFLAGAAVSVIGVQARFTTWTFDRYQSLITHRRETLRGVKINEYALRDIANVQITYSRSSKGSKTYRVELETRDGENIPLTSWYSSGYKNKERAADVIRAFLQSS